MFLVGVPMHAAKRKGGDRFKFQSVVDHYHLRPDYPPAIYEKLYSFVDERSRVLDMGCGPGKLTFPLAAHVAHVDAVDLSPAMIEAAQKLVAESDLDDANITWRAGDLLEVELAETYDLMVAGSAIHWMDQDELFPRLASRMSAGGRIAFANGDAAVNQPWGAEELSLMKSLQLAINEERPRWVDEATFPSPPTEELVGHELFQREESMRATMQVSMSIDAYIGVFFSRQSFALECMPVEVADKFRADMTALLAQFAEDGVIRYEIETFMEWGRLLKP